jgi:molybdate transport system ATP-binding protein
MPRASASASSVPPPLVSLEGVEVEIDGRAILRDLTWRLRPGEHWAVLGGNGSGKSTFLRLVRGELWPAPGSAGRRVYAFEGAPQTTAVGVAERIALVSPELQQRWLAREWTRTGLEVIHSGFGGGDYTYQRPTPRQRARADRVIALLGLAPFLRRDIQQLSTGELRKILIARALAGGPRVLACDEICDGLDATSRESLLRALDRLARGGTQMLFATHRAEEILPSIRHCLELNAGRARTSRRRAERPGTAEGSAGLRHGASGSADRRWFGDRRSGTGAGTPARTPPLIRLQRVDVYLDGRRVLRDLHWELRAGEHWAVTGPNGSGKSTFLKLLAGDLHPAWGGVIRWFGWPPGHGLWQLRRRLGCVSPELQAAWRDDTRGRDIVASGFSASIGLWQPPSPAARARAARCIDQLDLGHLADKTSAGMSYGECRLLLLARALVHEPSLLLCDEPFDGLDAPARSRMKAALDRAAARGTTLVVVTHHPADLPACVTRAARLDAGRLVEAGSR